MRKLSLALGLGLFLWAVSALPLAFTGYACGQWCQPIPSVAPTPPPPAPPPVAAPRPAAAQTGFPATLHCLMNGTSRPVTFSRLAPSAEEVLALRNLRDCWDSAEQKAAYEARAETVTRLTTLRGILTRTTGTPTQRVAEALNNVGTVRLPAQQAALDGIAAVLSLVGPTDEERLALAQRRLDVLLAALPRT